MKKIMFNDKYGLTKAVLEGRKTMTRRIAEKVLVEDIDQHLVWTGEFKKPKYMVGEVVAVVQSYKDLVLGKHEDREIDLEIMRETPGWNNKMFVKADLMPHQIRITNVRVERMQDISDEDCIKEGIGMRNSDVLHYSGPREAFAALIDRVSGKGTWGSNPWVFVYEFELVK